MSESVEKAVAFAEGDECVHKYQGNDTSCLLYSVVMALPNDKTRKAFTQSDNIWDFTYFLSWYYKNSEKCSQNPGLVYGFMDYDIVNYLKYLKSNKLIRNFKYLRLSKFNLELLYRQQRNTNHGLVVEGWGTTRDTTRKQAAKRMLRNFRKLTEQMKLPKLLCQTCCRRNRKRKRGYADFGLTKDDVTTHAVAIRIGADNVPVLLDPGKQSIKVMPDIDAFSKAFYSSLIDYWAVFLIKINTYP
jgi:hypothetical protein